MTTDSIVRELKAFITRELLLKPDDRLDDDQPLISGGLLDSLALARLAVFIEDRFGVDIPDLELSETKMDTLNQIAARVRRGRAA